MERIKRRLEDGLIPLLAPAPRVVLLGLPPLGDLGGQLRAEGIESLLAAHRLGVARRVAAGGFGRAAAARLPPDAAILWLGGATPGAVEAEGFAALADRPPRPLVFMHDPAAAVCPSPPGLAQRLAEHGWRPVLAQTDRAGPSAAAFPSGVRMRLLPDPAHALWGLLDQHPRGGAAACALDVPPDGSAAKALCWPALLPGSRRHALRLAHEALRRAPGGLPAWASAPLGIARGRALEAARRRLVAHDEIETGSLGASLFAALLGRPFRPAGPEAGAIARYWRRWLALPAPVAPAAPWSAVPSAGPAPRDSAAAA
ncbi:hypothetical protein GCM10010964_25890 [Caldovatus sediminis]|uniref:Uncharacterized protein n=1 Tax=Caldovatus sediminis TaxID=2041189 RepID=A0A8J2ZCF2_9PROT|nr:hypothetical protein [Caldovatus sediminis]GGG36903.1 hypothetical protein GCM10010964_25890 [Caldovatus sediminis]